MTDDLRHFTRHLFADPDAIEQAEEEVEQPSAGNVARSEGNHADPPSGDDLRSFTRELFGRDDY